MIKNYHKKKEEKETLTNHKSNKKSFNCNEFYIILINEFFYIKTYKFEYDMMKWK